ncbi:MAG: sodium/proline symporter [Candidatus Thalassarchaeaceae archaeon]|nr:sodium/proline symporter [Candidatus Thalassarchaeaceae archaeon]
MEMMLIISFLFFMTIFAGVGMASMLVKQDTTDDYLVAGRGMHPALAALSAVSTWNSGYMFIGFIGFTYLMGYSAIWLGLVSTIGQVVAWVWLYKFIQEEGNERGLRSLSSLVAEKAGAPEAKLAAILSVLFLCIYAAAQLTSGGKALFVMMGWPEIVGILIGFVLVVAYCYAGGIRASIWTDAAQSCVMVIGSTILCWIAIKEVGGFSGLDAGLEAQSTMLTNFLPPDLKFGISMWAFAFFLGGLGVAGQPQVVSRVMTLGSDSDRKQAMIWFFVWQTPFIILMLIIGMASRVLFNAEGFDAELGLPTMAMETMPAFGIGMILASIFAATMSTADSQVLACTAAITDDIKPEWRQDHKTTKKVTLVVAAFATMISIGGLYIPGGDSVFALVVLAVYGLGGIFIPLLTIRWMGYKPDSTHSISMMVAAFAGVIGWIMLGFSGGDGIFPSVPGMGAAFAVHFILNQVRTPDISSLGRYNWPDQKKMGAIAAAIIIPFGAFEASYLVTAPDSSGDANVQGEWLVELEFTNIANGEETIFVSDEGTEELEFVIPQLEGESLYALQFNWFYEETDEGGAWPDECDDVTLSLDPSALSGYVNYSTGEYISTNCGSYEGYLIVMLKDFEIDQFQSPITEGNSSFTTPANMTLGDVDNLVAANGFGRGPVTISVSVDTNTGGAVLVSNNEEGEDVTISWQAFSYTHTISNTDEAAS